MHHDAHQLPRGRAHTLAGKNDMLFAARCDSWDPEHPYEKYDKTLERRTMLTYRDARAPVRLQHP